MRHLWSLFAGIVAAPLTWLLIAMGQGGSTRAIEGWLDANSFDTVDLIEPAAYLAAAGVVLGLLATLRVSPLGPLVAGLLLVGVYLGMFIDPFAVRDAVPDDWELFDPIPLRLPLTNGTLLLIGALLLMAVFSVQRWRAWPVGPAAVAPAALPGEAPGEPAFGDTLPGEPPPGGAPEAATDDAAAGGTSEDMDRPTAPAESAASAPPAAWPASRHAAPAPPAPPPPASGRQDPRTATASGGADMPGQPTSPWSGPPHTPGTPAGTE
jgi:hypothetical protein